jgi:hypothetical protein
MRGLFRVFSLCLLATMIFGAWASTAFAQIRVWTDQQGRQVRGRLLRIDGDVVTLSINGRSRIIPIAQLSDDDRAYLKGTTAAAPPAAIGQEAPAEAPAADPAPPAAPPRVWTLNGREFDGAFSGADVDAFYLETATGQMRVEYRALTDEGDAREVVARLTAAKRDDLADRAAAAYEVNSGKSLSPEQAAPPPPVDAANKETTEPDPAAAGADDAAEDFGSNVVPLSDVTTADQIFKESAKPAEPSDADRAAFQTRVIWASVALIGLVAAVIGYGFLTMRRA